MNAFKYFNKKLPNWEGSLGSSGRMRRTILSCSTEITSLDYWADYSHGKTDNYRSDSQITRVLISGLCAEWACSVSVSVQDRKIKCRRTHHQKMCSLKTQEPPSLNWEHKFLWMFGPLQSVQDNVLAGDLFWRNDRGHSVRTDRPWVHYLSGGSRIWVRTRRSHKTQERTRQVMWSRSPRLPGVWGHALPRKNLKIEMLRYAFSALWGVL